jgi:hypothetical protein
MYYQQRFGIIAFAMNTKIRYEVDPYNRLICADSGKTKLSRFRKALTGKFKIDKDNALTYQIKAPVGGGTNIPHQVQLRGNWSLTDNHNLRFTLNKWGRQALGDQLTLQGNILDVSKNSLLFAATTKTKENVQTTYILNLRGAWQADSRNRLTFRIKREHGRYDILIFNGAWKINKNHRLIYQYEKARLIRKRKKIHTLIFKGHWDILSKSRISYELDKNSDSVFIFKTAAGVFKDKYIKYEVGITLARKIKPVKRIITLTGAWKIKKNAGLLFEVEYEDKKIHAINLKAKARLTSQDTISFKLKNQINKDIGTELKLSHKILKGDGQAFLRFLKSKRDPAALLGAGFRW